MVTDNWASEPTPELIEAVAKAIFMTDYMHMGEGAWETARLDGNSERPEAFVKARAALAAVRAALQEVNTCHCSAYSDPRGGGYHELMLEPEPDCPEHGKEATAAPVEQDTYCGKIAVITTTANPDQPQHAPGGFVSCSSYSRPWAVQCTGCREIFDTYDDAAVHATDVDATAEGMRLVRRGKQADQ